MNAPPLIRNLVDRLRHRSTLRFACPACERDIVIYRSDCGSDLICPQCTAWITAPVPDLNLKPLIRDERLLRAKKYQEANKRELSELKEGRFHSAVIRKYERLRREYANPGYTPGFPLTPQNQGLNQPPANVELANPLLPAALEPLKRKPRPLNATRFDNTAYNSAPLNHYAAVNNTGDRILSWNLDPGGLPYRLLSLARSHVRLLWILGAAVAVLWLIILVRRDVEFTREQIRETVASTSLSERTRLDLERARQLEIQKLEAPKAIARQALTVTDWRDLLPFVRHPVRVRPIMENYYAEHPWTPFKLKSFGQGDIQDVAGKQFAVLSAIDESGETLHIGLEDMFDGWKIDWEVLVPLARIEWAKFIEERPFDSRILRASAIRRTPASQLLSASRTTKENVFGVMLWGEEISEGAVYAILDKDSPMARELAGHLSFARGKRVILDLSFIPVAKDRPQDLVSINRIVEIGWTFPEEIAPGRPVDPKAQTLNNALGLPSTSETPSP